MSPVRRVIAGKLYDTEKANEIAVRIEMEYREGLYSSRKGQLFIAIENIGLGGTDSLKLVELSEATEWLDQVGADETAYEELGVEIEEG